MAAEGLLGPDLVFQVSTHLGQIRILCILGKCFYSEFRGVQFVLSNCD